MRFKDEPGLKIPHMGWNSIASPDSSNGEDGSEGAVEWFSPPLEGLGEASSSPVFVYFVHSFYVPVCQETTAVCHYIHPFSAAMQKDNFFATQFHPEKSGKAGQQILHNFLTMTPSGQCSMFNVQ